jgi:alkenylglycerophosphocholine/alkenylglycerophosphoethanolamine hydrolase
VTDERRSTSGLALAAIGVAAALAYLAGPAEFPPALRLATKPIPALALAAWVALRHRAWLGRLVAAGLVLSAAGDALLETGRFPPGLLAFLAAHLAYLAGFLSAASRPALLRALPFAAWGAGVYAVLRPGLGEMTIPVAVYMTVICAMMWRAAARVGGPTPRAAWLGLAGALAFATSDTLIAFDRFHAAIPGAAWPVMILYWLGQWGIAASAMDG